MLLESNTLIALFQLPVRKKVLARSYPGVRIGRLWGGGIVLQSLSLNLHFD